MYFLFGYFRYRFFCSYQAQRGGQNEPARCSQTPGRHSPDAADIYQAGAHCGPRRPVQKRRTLLYEEAELHRFRRELEEKKRWRLPKPDNPSTETVSFRLDVHYLKRLSETADRHRMSAGEFARLLVIQALDERTPEAIGELREDLATSVLALLVLAGNQDADEARAWVNKNLRRKE